MANKKTKLIRREPYSSILESLKDDGRIKVVSGLRRTGKSSLLILLMNDLLKEGIGQEQIVHLNFEIYKYGNWNSDDLYNYLKTESDKVNNKKLYIFLDEVQVIPGWEKVVNSLRLEIDCDIYVTGSNANLVSNNFSTFLSGRTATLEILPFSFAEFLKVRELSYERRPEKFLKNKWRISDEEGNEYNLEELFAYYVRYGGIPSLTGFNERERIELELNDLTQTVIARDIIQSRMLSNQRSITDLVLLNRVIQISLNNIGNFTSLNQITNTLNDSNLIDSENTHKPNNKTITSYVNAIKEAFLLYEVNRFDLKGKSPLTTLNKYYAADTGLCNFILDYPEGEAGFTLENLVFLELKRRGFKVNVGKINNREIDFYVRKSGKKYFIQVTESLETENEKERELTPFRKLKAVGKKIIITGEVNGRPEEIEDVRIIPIIDFLLDPNSLS